MYLLATTKQGNRSGARNQPLLNVLSIEAASWQTAFGDHEALVDSTSSSQAGPYVAEAAYLQHCLPNDAIII